MSREGRSKWNIVGLLLFAVAAATFFCCGGLSREYLGLLISSDLSWSNHIQSICSKARKILGLLYRKYCKFSDQATLLQLYISLVRPHLEYSAPVWNPHLQRDIQMLERTQKFACRMCTKTWNAGYEELQNTLQLPSLSI